MKRNFLTSVLVAALGLSSSHAGSSFDISVPVTIENQNEPEYSAKGVLVTGGFKTNTGPLDWYELGQAGLESERDSLIASGVFGALLLFFYSDINHKKDKKGKDINDIPPYHPKPPKGELAAPEPTLAMGALVLAGMFAFRRERF